MKLVCLGANNPETIRVINAIRRKYEPLPSPSFEFWGFVDNDKEKWGTDFYGYPVFGGMDEVLGLSEKGAVFCNLITRDCATRYETTRDLVKAGGTLVNLIHPNVNLELVELGMGNYIQESVIVQAGVRIGNNSSISAGSHIGHEGTIGSSVFIAPGCHLAGCIAVQDGVLIGTGASILPRLSIGKWSTIGAGAVVIRDVPPYSVVVGVPAKVIREVDKKYDSGDVY